MWGNGSATRLVLLLFPSFSWVRPLFFFFLLDHMPLALGFFPLGFPLVPNILRRSHRQSTLDTDQFHISSCRKEAGVDHSGKYLLPVFLCNGPGMMEIVDLE